MGRGGGKDVRWEWEGEMVCDGKGKGKECEKVRGKGCEM
jgi:hypothetical protein